jgi:hypothetical protein
VQKRTGITLRMLLSHTGKLSGIEEEKRDEMLMVCGNLDLGIVFFNPEIRKYGFPAGLMSFRDVSRMLIHRFCSNLELTVIMV